MKKDSTDYIDILMALGYDPVAKQKLRKQLEEALKTFKGKTKRYEQTSKGLKERNVTENEIQKLKKPRKRKTSKKSRNNPR